MYAHIVGVPRSRVYQGTGHTCDLGAPGSVVNPGVSGIQVYPAFGYTQPWVYLGPGAGSCVQQFVCSQLFDTGLPVARNRPALQHRLCDRTFLGGWWGRAGTGRGVGTDVADVQQVSCRTQPQEGLESTRAAAQDPTQ